jgi:hypothetical protein
VNVLSVALSDVDAYVGEEQAATKKNRVSKTGEKPQTDLQVVVKMLNLINGRIGMLYANCLVLLILIDWLLVDTRAAHLDRSRTKAAIQRLAYRIYYQRLWTLGRGRQCIDDFLNT